MHGPDMTGVQFSLISALRTGHFAVDLAIALLVPIIIKFFCVDAARMARLVFEHLYARARRDDRYCTRTISCVSVGSSVAGREHKNNVLQKAIALYLTEVPGLHVELVGLRVLHKLGVHDPDLIGA